MREALTRSEVEMNRINATLWVALLAALAPGLSAETLIVPDQFPSIQAAIDAAADGDTVLVQPGIYAERIVWASTSIRVRSAGGAAVTAIDASELGPGSVVQMNGVDGPVAELRGFTITGGSAADGAGLALQGGAPVIADCVITGNHAGARVGGGVLSFGSRARFERSVFRGNSAALGGAVHIYGGPSFTDCLFENNHADRAGAVYTLNSFAIFEGCLFRGNSADASASALETVFPVGVDVADSLSSVARPNRRSSATGSISAAI